MGERAFIQKFQKNVNSKFPFQLKVMMKKLLKITEILRCRKAHNFQTIKYIDPQL